MKIAIMATALALSLGALNTGAALAYDEHSVLSPNDIKWVPGPASLPKGAQMAVLYGDPSKEGLFAMRVRLPAGYHIPPHTHPKPEVVTILSGVAHLGPGTSADKDKTRSLPAGGFFVISPGTPHYVYIDRETVVQLNSIGPWGITYINEVDDPRKTQ